ncbi:hypothetical protein GmRootV213_58100 (plasmid) [Variovorax sp. V213]
MVERRVGGDHRDAAQAVRMRAQHVEHEAVVRAQETRLHQHGVRNVVGIEQAEVCLRRRVVVRRMPGALRERQAAEKDMRMAVDGANLSRSVENLRCPWGAVCGEQGVPPEGEAEVSARTRRRGMARSVLYS